jgi:hypothetical protein
MPNRLYLSHRIITKFNLVWAFLPILENREFITGADPKYGTNGKDGGSNKWGKAVKSLSTTNGAIYFPNYEPFLDLTTRFSILVAGTVEALADFSTWIAITANSTWTPPYARLTFGREGTTTRCRVGYAPVGGFTTTVSDLGMIQVADGTAQYGATRDGSTFRFIKNGAQFSSNSGGSNPISWTSAHSVNLMNHHYNDPNEGIQGLMNYALVFANPIGVGEARFIYDDPSAIFERSYKKAYPFASSSAYARASMPRVSARIAGRVN